MIHRLYLFRTGRPGDEPIRSFHADALEAFKYFTKLCNDGFEYKEARCWEVIDGEFIVRWNFKAH